MTSPTNRPSSLEIPVDADWILVNPDCNASAPDAASTTTAKIAEMVDKNQLEPATAQQPHSPQPITAVALTQSANLPAQPTLETPETTPVENPISQPLIDTRPRIAAFPCRNRLESPTAPPTPPSRYLKAVMPTQPMPEMPETWPVENPLSQPPMNHSDYLALVKAHPTQNTFPTVRSLDLVTHRYNSRWDFTPHQYISANELREVTEGCPNTCWLDFSGDVVPDNELNEALQIISKLPLYHLSLAKTTRLNEYSMPYLESPHLRSLDLSYTRVGSFYLNLLSDKFPSLNTLKLSHCRTGHDELIHLQGLPLQDLDLSHCRNMNNRGLKYLTPLLSLKKLDLSHCLCITNIRTLANPGLRELNLRYTAISTLWRPGDVIPPLTHLDLSYTEIDLSELRDLNKESLKSLALAKCKDVSNGTLELLDRFSLEHLDLSYCAIGDKALEHLCKHPLKSLNIAGTAITKEGIEALKARFPDLQLIH